MTETRFDLDVPAGPFKVGGVVGAAAEVDAYLTWHQTWTRYHGTKVPVGTVFTPSRARVLMAANYRHHFTSFPTTKAHWAFDLAVPSGPAR